MYVKIIYTGIDECDFEPSHALVENIQQQTVRGFQNVGFATEGSKLFIGVKESEDTSSYWTNYRLEAARYRVITASSVTIETTINVHTDHEAQIHWVEVDSRRKAIDSFL